MTEVFAPAKVNLTLHVTGQRDDGYHLLDSLVCFPSIGDRLTFQPSEKMALTIHNAPDLPTDGSNLVMQAAQMVLGGDPHAMELFKSLPIAAGIGGGSGNAGAVFRYAADRAGTAYDPIQVSMLGADVPVCVASKPQRFQGIGEIVTPIDPWPQSAYMLLVNPRVPVSTPQIFTALEQKSNPPMPADLPHLGTIDDLVSFIASQRNDLQGPAIAQQPVIAEVIDTITATPGCLFARMSGSGATCFGIYDTHEQVLKAAASIGSIRADWWVDYGDLQFKRDTT